MTRARTLPSPDAAPTPATVAAWLSNWTQLRDRAAAELRSPSSAAGRTYGDVRRDLEAAAGALEEGSLGRLVVREQMRFPRSLKAIAATLGRRAADVYAAHDAATAGMAVFLGPEDDASINPIVNALGILATVVRDLVLPALTALAGAIFEQLGAAVGWVQENWPLIQRTFEVVVAAIATLWAQHGQTIVTVVQAAWTIVKTTIGMILDNVLSLVRATMQLLTGDWSGAWDTLTSLVGRNVEAWLTILGAAASAVFAVLDDLSGGALSRIGEWMSSTASAVGDGMRAVEDAVRSGWQAAQDAVSSILPAIRSAIMDVWNLLPEDIRRDLELITTTLIDRGAAWVSAAGAAMANMLTAITTALGQLVDAVTTWATSTFLAPIQGLVGTATGAATEVGSGIHTSITAKLGEVVAWLGGWVGNFLAPITNLIGAASAEAMRLGQSIVDGIVNALGAGVGAIRDAAYRAARAALDAAIAVIQPGSPSRVFTQLGETIGQGLALGINRSASAVGVAMQGVLSAVVSASNQVLTRLAHEAMAMAEAARQAAIAASRARSLSDFSRVVDQLGQVFGHGGFTEIAPFPIFAPYPTISNPPPIFTPSGPGAGLRGGVDGGGIQLRIYLGNRELRDWYVETGEELDRQGRAPWQ